MAFIKLHELTNILSNAINHEVQAAIGVAAKAKGDGDMENFLMAQSYVLGLQKAVTILNTVLHNDDKSIIVER
jgi:hypothetical protein